MSSKTESKQSRSEEAVPYRGDQPYGKLEDLVIPEVLEFDGDERLWVPQAKDVSFRPLLLSLSQGYYVNLLRVRRSGILSRHRHAGPVHATTLKGRWHYLEYDWWAEQGSYSFEPPGDIHTLEVPDGVEEMITLFHVVARSRWISLWFAPPALLRSLCPSSLVPTPPRL